VTTTIDWDALETKDGVCLLCGAKMDERFYSGSYETYLTCGCELRKKLSELTREVRVILDVADKRRDEINKEKKVREMYKQLENLDPDRRLDPKREEKHAS
jgi:hypothetical protein